MLEFLRAIYRPHNVYCLHIDSKSTHSFKQIFFNVAACLDNVIIPRKLESVYWGWHTFLDAQMRCFSALLLARVEYPWKYVITLCGKEVPLRTNVETVAILELLNGTSSVWIVGDYGANDYKFKWKWSLNKMTGWITMRDDRAPPTYPLRPEGVQELGIRGTQLPLCGTHTLQPCGNSPQGVHQRCQNTGLRHALYAAWNTWWV